MDKQELKIEHEREQDRYYIPVGEKYEVQTRGRGSTYRILNKDTGHRELIMDECTHEFLTDMARDLHAEYSQLNARIKELEEVVSEFSRLVKNKSIIHNKEKYENINRITDLLIPLLNKGIKK